MTNTPALGSDLIAAIDTLSDRDRAKVARSIELGHCWPSADYDSRVGAMISATACHAFRALNATDDAARNYYLGMADAYERLAREEIASATR